MILTKAVPKLGKRGRVKTPLVIQMEAAECGAAALSIILSYYRCYIPAEEIRRACGVSRDGSKASNILKAARKYGLKAIGARAEDIESLKTVTLPAILHWEFNHFVVLEGFGKHNVYINDPAYGPREISFSHLDQSFTGFLLLFEPSSDFKKVGKPFSVVNFIRKRLFDSYSLLVFALISSLSLLFIGVIIPGFSKIFIDHIMIEEEYHLLKPLLIGMGITACLRTLFMWLQARCFLALNLRLILKITTQFIAKLLTLPMSFFQQRYTGDILARISANTRISQLLSYELIINLSNMILMGFYALILALINLKIFLFVLLGVVLKILILIHINKRVAIFSFKMIQETGKLLGIVVIGLSMINHLKAAACENEFFRKWFGSFSIMLNSQADLLINQQILTISTFLLSGLSTIIVLFIGCIHVIEGQMTIGSLVAFQTLAASFEQPLGSLLALGTKFQTLKTDISRLNDILNADSEVPPLKQIKKDHLTSIELQKVTFGYSNLEPAFIKNLTLKIDPGRRVALIGLSGSGKSTVVKLISGLYEPWDGKILLEGILSQKLDKQSIADSLAIVDQNILLVEGTIRENLAFYNSSVPEEDLIQALKDACLYETVLERGSLEAYVAESGLNFSGGERQRLEIAKALALNPRILILDEATSALDSILEAQIYQNIRQRKITLFIISHRLSAIRNCDDIVILANGSIIERGTHEKLITCSPFYQKLMRLE